jgi:hypothetical protein
MVAAAVSPVDDVEANTEVPPTQQEGGLATQTDTQVDRQQLQAPYTAVCADTAPGSVQMQRDVLSDKAQHAGAAKPCRQHFPTRDSPESQAPIEKKEKGANEADDCCITGCCAAGCCATCCTGVGYTLSMPDPGCYYCIEEVGEPLCIWCAFIPCVACCTACCTECCNACV